MAGGAATIDYGRVAEVFLATWGPAPSKEERVATSGRRQDHYEVLGVNPDAPDEVIRAAYRALAAKYHPDRNPSDGDAELKLKRLNAAFRVLGDPKMRKQYDELTQSPEASDNAPPDPRKETPSPGKVPGKNTREEPPARKPSTHAGGPNKKRILAIILKTAGYLFLAFVAIVGGLFFYMEKQENESRAEQAAVTVEAQYQPTACPQERPVSVMITNKSKRTLKSLSFSLQAFENGRSDDLALDSDELESHAIVLPGEISKTCWKFPSLKRSASVFFRAEKRYDGATFYDANEFVPRTEVPRDPGAASVTPVVSDAMQKELAARLQYLSAAVPRAPGPPAPSAPSTWSTTDAQELAFRDKAEIVASPMAAMTHMQQGTLSDAHLDALKTNYPVIYDEMKKQIMTYAAAHPDIKLPMAERASVAKFLGVPLDAFDSPDSIRALQATYVIAPGGAPDAAPSGAMTGGIVR
jgi:curved DNA-binding protein CbpA